MKQEANEELGIGKAVEDAELEAGSTVPLYSIKQLNEFIKTTVDNYYDITNPENSLDNYDNKMTYDSEGELEIAPITVSGKPRSLPNNMAQSLDFDLTDEELGIFSTANYTATKEYIEKTFYFSLEFYVTLEYPTAVRDSNGDTKPEFCRLFKITQIFDCNA